MNKNQIMLKELYDLEFKYKDEFLTSEFLNHLYGYISFSLLVNHDVPKEEVVTFLTECHEQTTEKLKKIDIKKELQ